MRLARLWAGAVAAAALVGCSGHVQGTSGGRYLAAYPQQTRTSAVDEAVRRAAAVEPTLRFPARIGLARVEGGRLTAVPRDEADAWVKPLEGLGGRYGEFVPVSPLVAAMAAGELPARGDGYDRARRVVDEIRVGAGRQHMDAVLVYEVASTNREESTPLSVLEWTILGAYILPTRNRTDAAAAQAMLIDVRSGYPYITALGEADAETLTTVFGGKREHRAAAVRAEAVKRLAAQMPELFAKLEAARAAGAGRAEAEPAREP